MSTPLTWNANIISNDGHSRTVDFRGKWLNYRDTLATWKPVSLDFRQDGNNLISDASPWSISCPDNATKAIAVANRQGWDIHTKSGISDPDMVLELRHPGARPVSPVLIPGREFQVVYPNAIQDGIDIVVGQWHGRGVRAEHIYAIRSMPPGDTDYVPITCELSASGKWLPIPNGVPVPINHGMSVPMPGATKRGCSIRPPVAWYYDAAGEMVRKPITASIRRLTSGKAELTKYVPRALIAEALAARPGGELRVDVTSTFYPDPNTETTSVDGFIARVATSDTWSQLRDGAGTTPNDTTADNYVASFTTHASTTDRYTAMRRAVFLFDTSALTGATITSAVFSVYGVIKFSSFTVDPLIDLNVYASTPGSNTALVAADYSQVGSTAYCDTAISNAAFSTSGYNDMTLNATGLAAISTTGVTKLGTRNANYDVANSAVPWEASKFAGLYIYYADNTGTSQDPKLVVTYTAPEGHPAVKRFGGVPFAHSLGRGVW